MAYYDLSKTERDQLYLQMHLQIADELETAQFMQVKLWSGDADTYIRKNVYLILGRLFAHDAHLILAILNLIKMLSEDDNELCRQTAINAAGEIGKTNFDIVQHYFDTFLFDPHHKVRNAVIGSIKKMGEVNPVPVLNWAKLYLHHPEKEIRREICHGIELRGRKHPQDILPLLQELENDQTARVRKTLVHVLGQIAYKINCLETVCAHLSQWQNKSLVKDALFEIVDVHERYKNFAHYNQQQALAYVQKQFPEFNIHVGRH